MTVSRVAVTSGAPAAATAFSPTLPSHAAGDRLILFVGGKYNTTTVPTINQSWILLNSGTGGIGSAANDAGQTFWAVYAIDATSGSMTAPTVTPGATAPNSWEWICSSFRTTTSWKDALGTSWTWCKGASDTNTAAALGATTATYGAGNHPTAGDLIAGFGVIPTDTGSALGTTTLTAGGLSGGTITTTSGYIENILGQDSASVHAIWTGFTGTATGGVTHSYTITGASDMSGSVVAVALRENAYTGPVWQSVGTPAAAAAGTSAAPTLPGSIAANDIVVVDLYVETGTLPTITPPDGTWTQEISEANTSGNQLSHYLFWKRMAGGESGTVTFSWTGSFWKEATAHRISGCATSGNPFLAETSADSGGSSVTTTPAVSLSGLTGDTLLFWSSANWNGGADVTPPTGFTERHDGGTLGSATKQHSTSSTGTVQGSWNISNTQTAILVALTATSSGTPVTGSIATSWNVAAQVTGSALETWNTREEVTKSAAESWDTYAPVTGSAAESWNVFTPVTGSAAESWNVRELVTGSALETWNVAGPTPVTGSSAQSWNVRELVTKTAAESWNVYAVVTNSAAESWNVYAPVTSSAAESWNVRALVTGSAAESWNVFVPVTGSAAESWNVFTAVSAALQQSWRVLTAVTGTSGQTWNVRALVTGSAAESWNTYAVVTGSSAQSWRVLVVVSNSSAQSWNVLGAGQVTGGISQSWNVRSLVTGTAQESWNVLTLVTGSNAQSWRVYAPVTGSNANSWNVRALVTGSNANSWNVRELVTGSAPESWNVYVPVTGSANETWSVLVPVSKSAAVSWDVYEIVTGSSEQLWDVYEIVTGSSEQLWDVFVVNANADLTRFVLPLSLETLEASLVLNGAQGSLGLSGNQLILILGNRNIPLQLASNQTGLKA